MTTAGNTVLLQPKEGVELQHNKTYLVALSGIKDLAGNQVVVGGSIDVTGNYASWFVSLDTLAPHESRCTGAKTIRWLPPPCN